MTASSEQHASPFGPLAAVALLHDKYKYRQLTRNYLKTLPRLFQELTGLKLCLAWAPAWSHLWKTQGLPTYSWLCRRTQARHGAALARCQRCSARHLALTLKSGHAGHAFTCHRGVRNFWFPIIVGLCTVGIAFVQALAAEAGPPAGQTASPARTPPASRHTKMQRRGWAGARRVSRQEFEQAARLLRLIFEHVQSAALADLRKEDLTKAQQAVLEFQTVVGRLREDLNELVPAFRKTPPVLHAENRAQAMVHAALERLQQDYARPISLRECARDLGLNAAYLSALFSRFVGLPFKTFLTELRMEKARELLSHPARSIADVAYAVGYASENRFRIAFKSATGLSPKVWRETLRMERPAPTP